MFSQAIPRQGSWWASTGQKSLALMKNISAPLRMIWYYLASKVVYSKLYTYENIPLRLFIDLANNGHLEKLIIKSRGFVSKEKLTAHFEQIVKRNSEASGSFQYLTYFQLLKSYGQLLAEYTIVKSLLLKLAISVEFPTILEIRARGYKISTDDSTAYAVSLTSALRKVSNLVTKATMKRNELEKFAAEQDKSPESYEAVVANLSAGLGFSVSYELTLAAYNEFVRIVHSRAKKARQWQK